MAAIIQVYELPGEEVITYPDEDRWQTVGVWYRDGHRETAYYHVNCDSLADRDGKCFICGRAARIF